MFSIATKTWQDNGLEVIISDDIKWLNEWNVQKQLGHSNFRKERQELQECNKQSCRVFLREDLGIQVILDCRKTPAVNFKRRLGFKQHDPLMTQEQSVLTKLGTYFKTEVKLFQHSVLGYRIDLYVPKYKLAIEVD